MDENKKNPGFFESIVKDVLGYVTQNVSARISVPVAGYSEAVMQNVEDRVLRMEKKALRSALSFIVIGLGALSLLISLLFYLTESLKWSRSDVFALVGVAVLITGLLLKIWEMEE